MSILLGSIIISLVILIISFRLMIGDARSNKAGYLGLFLFGVSLTIWATSIVAYLN